MAGVQEQDGCNHGVVAVPGAVLFRKMMRQNVPTFTWLRVRFEPATHRDRDEYKHVDLAGTATEMT